MPNTYFDFKQFRIDQGQSGMKVTTEGCILGAWANANQPNKILDIGTGTGLLSLMLAQKYADAKIDAVELEPHAAAEARSNFQKSRWSTNLTLHENSIQAFANDSDYKYNLIVCNPPFFKNSQRSHNIKKAKATHNDQLTPTELIQCLLKLLDPQGTAFIIYPLAESQLFENEIQNTKLYIVEELLVYDRKDKAVLRRILKIAHNPITKPASQTLIIKEDNGDYTSSFTELLKPFYLHL